MVFPNTTRSDALDDSDSSAVVAAVIVIVLLFGMLLAIWVVRRRSQAGANVKSTEVQLGGTTPHTTNPLYVRSKPANDSAKAIVPLNHNSLEYAMLPTANHRQSPATGHTQQRYDVLQREPHEAPLYAQPSSDFSGLADAGCSKDPSTSMYHVIRDERSASQSTPDYNRLHECSSSQNHPSLEPVYAIPPPARNVNVTEVTTPLATSDDEAYPGPVYAVFNETHNVGGPEGHYAHAGVVPAYEQPLVPVHGQAAPAIQLVGPEEFC